MIPRDSNGEPYDHWARGGASVKARMSNTTVRYGTQVLDLPVLQVTLHAWSLNTLQVYWQTAVKLKIWN